MVAKGFVGGNGNSFVRSPDAFGTTAEGTAIRHIIGRYDIIHTINLIHMMALADGIALGDNHTISTLNRTAHIRLQFGTVHLAILMDGINLTVVVEKHGEIVDVALHVMMLPRATDILRGITLQTFTVDVGKHIKLAVSITDGRCPNTLTVNLLVVFERESIVIEIETIKAIRDILPVNQILGVQNHQTRHGMHGGTSQIVVVAHTQNVGIGKLIVEKRVGKCAITVIGRPRLGECRSKRKVKSEKHCYRL